MKALFLILFLVSSSAYGVTIECKNNDTKVQLFHIGGYEHRLQIIEGNTIIASQAHVFCGNRSGYVRGKNVAGGECNSHLGVGADARYKQPADFYISYVWVSSRTPKNRNGRAKADLKATFLNKETKATESIELNGVSCSVAQ